VSDVVRESIPSLLTLLVTSIICANLDSGVKRLSQ